MKKRWLFVLLGVMGVGLLLSPFLLHTWRFNATFRANRGKWADFGSTSYEIVVASNSLTRPTAGWNTIRVVNGEIIAAENPDCAGCPLDDFTDLTVGALFDLIENVCLPRFPFPICNLVYDEALGYPRRVNTYAVDEKGEHLPSITVESVQLLK